MIEMQRGKMHRWHSSNLLLHFAAPCLFPSIVLRECPEFEGLLYAACAYGECREMHPCYVKADKNDKEGKK